MTNYNAVKKINVITRVVSNHFGISERELVDGGIAKRFAVPRSYALYICDSLWILTREDISLHFGLTVDHIRQVVTGIGKTISGNKTGSRVIRELRFQADEIIIDYRNRGLLY